MKDYQPRPIELDSSMMAFLQEAAARYDLPDAGKAIRCLVNFARENPDKQDDIFNAIRCLGC
jgi:hypothetical protein